MCSDASQHNDDQHANFDEPDFVGGPAILLPSACNSGRADPPPPSTGGDQMTPPSLQQGASTSAPTLNTGHENTLACMLGWEQQEAGMREHIMPVVRSPCPAVLGTLRVSAACSQADAVAAG